MNISTALKIAAEAAAFPRFFEGWPLSEAEESAEISLREAGKWEVLPEFRLLPEEKASLDAEARDLAILCQQQMAAQRERDVARDAALRADAMAQKNARWAAKKAAKKPFKAATITAKVVYLGQGFYGIRVDRSIRKSREVGLPGLTSADRGREVTVEVGEFDAKII